MSTTNPQNETPQPKTLGVLAEFPGPDELVDAAAKTTDAGYKQVEAFSPFPIHGIDEALKNKKTILPWIVFCCGLTGCLIALSVQYYVNGVEGPWAFSGYEYPISGKPSFSLPANIPVTFEVIVLLSAFGAFFGMLALNGLPRLSNPLFKNERFSTATSHGFFLWIDNKDDMFSESNATTHFNALGATAVEPVHEEATGHDVPGVIYMVGVVGAAIALVPPFWVAAAMGPSSEPRLSIWWDMDYQPKYKAQTAASNSLFSDGRSMRKAVPGTIARGMLQDDLRYYQGKESELDLAAAKPSNTQFVNLLQDETPAGDGGGAADDAAEPVQPEPVQPEPDWTTVFPEQVEISAATMDRGQQRFDIYCSTCHGRDGEGKGLITLRAQALRQSTWVPPTSLYTDDVRKQPVGKLFSTISHGVRRMPGYAQQISVADRWAIVMYVRALQRQRAATIDDVPAEVRDKLK